MCVLAFAWKAHPRWRLIVAGNRDELHTRPASALARWEGQGQIFAGRDLRSGGTWLGASEEGRFVVVTNLRGYGEAQPDKASRGALVTDLLTGKAGYSGLTDAGLDNFNPFNLILADGDGAHFLSNRPIAIRSNLGPGIFGLSNGRLDEPWPKTVRIKAGLLDWLVKGAEGPEELFTVLREDQLPDVGLPTPEPSDIPEEARQSPIFILDPVYGTRCSTVVAVDEDGQGLILERSFAPDGTATGTTELTFRWPDS
ncbi:MAG TPA: NRDE family protein [Sphingobium sp.]|uniref:NRDE family protein n=1 Tax=Sphingobium sp. TaxID=1912891 RepID=UPI002ED565B6